MPGHNPDKRRNNESASTMHQFTNFTYTYTDTKHQIDPLRVTIIAIRVDHTIPYGFELGLGDIYSLQNGTLEGILGF